MPLGRESTQPQVAKPYVKLVNGPFTHVSWARNSAGPPAKTIENIATQGGISEQMRIH